MRGLNVSLHLILLILQLQGPQLQGPLSLRDGPPVKLEPASVDGIVVDSQTKQPMAGVTVLAVDRSGSGAQVITVTGNDGRFAFHGIPPGLYTIEASRPGYSPEVFGKPAIDARSLPPNSPVPRDVPIVQQLAPGQVLSSIRFELTPGGVITGRLTDERGNVVAGAVVQAMKTTYINGLRERTPVQAVVSNDLGEYRFFMLKPGQYFISLVPPTLSISLISIQGFSIPLLYPGTIDVKAATTVEIHVGETIEGVDFRSIPTKNRRISGGVQGNGSDGVTVILSPANGTAQKRFSITSDNPTTDFQFNDIVPGNYELVAENIYGRAVVPLDVRNADLLGTRIVLGADNRIPAHVRIEGHPPGDDSEVEKLYFVVRQDGPVPGLEDIVYSPNAQGRFIPGFLNRDYWIEITRTEDYYIKSITLEGIDVLNRGLHVTNSTDVPMEIVVDNHFGQVQGTAAAGNVTVVLVPDTARRKQRPLYRSLRTSNGSFSFEKVPPGDYKLFAWSESTIENGGPWLEPEYLHIYEDRGTLVRIQGDMKTVLNRPIPVF
jgi:Carboxypeptidase regulatory-like domain